MLTVLAILPPVGALAPTDLWAQSLQYCLLAFFVAPAAALAVPALAERLAAQVDVAGRVGRRRAALALGIEVAVTIAWRLPGPVDALARTPWLVGFEAVTLVVGGLPLWSLLTVSALRHVVHRPRRMALSAASMWSAWIAAFVVGFAGHAWYPAYATPHPGQLGVVSAQELGVVIIWLCSGAAFAPVVFSTLAAWLGGEEDDADRQLWRRTLGPGTSAPGRVSARSSRDGTGAC